VLCGEIFQHLCPAAYSEKEMNKIIKKEFSSAVSVGSARYKFLAVALPRCVLCGLCEI